MSLSWDSLNPVNWFLRTTSPAVLYPAPPPIPTLNTEEIVNELLMTLNAGRGGYTRHNLGSDKNLTIWLRKCSPIPAIISQKAFAFVKGTITVWNPESGKPVRGRFKEWEELFRRPNKYQSSRQFFTLAYSFQQHYGYCVIEPLYPAGFIDRPAELHVIPNRRIEWEWQGYGRSTRPKAAYEVINGERRPLDVDRLIIIRDPASTELQENEFLPLARAADLESEISNHIASMEARGEMVTDRGAVGIISNIGKDAVGALPMDADEKARVQYALNGHGIMRGQNKRIVTDSALSYTPMTFTVDELGLHPEHIANIKAICNRYGFPFTKLAEGFEGKYNNSSDGRRDFQDTTIDPESMDFFEQLSLGLKMYDQRCEVYMDYSGVASVQASQEEKGKGLKAMNEALVIEWDNNLITRNQWLEQLGREAVQNELFDKFKYELSPEELGAVVPENQNTNENQQTESGQASA